MIQITDISQLSSIRDNLSSSLSVHGENWHDDVFARIESQYASPAMSQMASIISSAQSDIMQICSIFGEMEQIASCY